jgi:hypothetical protein
LIAIAKNNNEKVGRTKNIVKYFMEPCLYTEMEQERNFKWNQEFRCPERFSFKDNKSFGNLFAHAK